MSLVLNIQKFCLNDGPGIRTVIFLKGCPLRCVWCHNPESQSINKELAFRESLCLNCFKCIDICSNHQIMNNIHVVNYYGCNACGKCIDVCSNALEIYGKEMSVKEIISEVLKDKDYYINSNGGVTISGGEPLYNYEFTLQILKELKKENIHTCLETSGFASINVIEKLMPYVDLFLYDIKEFDPELHLKFTGVDNKLILENLKKLNDNNKDIILRCPLIPKYNLDLEHLKNIGLLASKYQNIKQVEVLPYHPLGKVKNSEINKINTMEEIEIPTEKEVEMYISEIKKYTSKTVKRA